MRGPTAKNVPVIGPHAWTENALPTWSRVRVADSGQQRRRWDGLSSLGASMPVLLWLAADVRVSFVYPFLHLIVGFARGSMPSFEGEWAVAGWLSSDGTSEHNK